MPTAPSVKGRRKAWLTDGGAFRGRMSLRHFTHLHTRSDWMTDPSLPRMLTIFQLFEGTEGSNGANGSTMHCASVPIQSQWGSVNGRRQWARGVLSLYVHTRSELSYQIAGSLSLSMGKSDQRYQRPKLSNQSVQKKLKTVELYANY